jgi:hypothetical protein
MARANCQTALKLLELRMEVNWISIYVNVILLHRMGRISNDDETSIEVLPDQLYSCLLKCLSNFPRPLRPSNLEKEMNAYSLSSRNVI